MANFAAFVPQGNTVALAVTSTSHAATQVAGSPAIGSMQYRVVNVGPNTAFIVMGGSGVAAAVIPTDGSNANGMPVLNGEVKIFTGPANAYFTAICASTQTATLYITPGEGIN